MWSKETEIQGMAKMVEEEDPELTSFHGHTQIVYRRVTQGAGTFGQPGPPPDQLHQKLQFGGRDPGSSISSHSPGDPIV